MPKSDSKNTLMRQWEMLRLLETQTWLTTADITGRLANRGYEVDQRTVQRDLEKLSKIFTSLDYNKKSAPYGWRWLPGSDLGVRGLSVPEALSLKMVDEFLTPMLPASMLESLRPRLKQATETLDSLRVINNTAIRWTEKIRVVHPTMNTQPPVISHEVMATVQDALLREKQLEIAYQSVNSDTPTTSRIHPLAMVQRGPVTYLVCTFFDYTDIRFCVMHRMSAATLLDDGITQPEDFDIDRFIREGYLHFGEGGDIALKLWANKDAAKYMTESPLSEDMAMQESGEGYEVIATVQNTWQLKWWLLSQASNVKVLEPVELREVVVRNLKEALGQYE